MPFKAAKTIKLDGREYIINPYGPSFGLKLLAELFLLLGEGTIRLALSVKSGVKPGQSILDADINEEAMQASVGALFQKLTPEKFEDIVKKILDQTLLGSSSISVVQQFEITFMGDYLHLFKLVWKTLEAQYGDFLGALGGLGKSFTGKATSARQSSSNTIQT